MTMRFALARYDPDGSIDGNEQRHSSPFEAALNFRRNTSPVRARIHCAAVFRILLVPLQFCSAQDTVGNKCRRTASATDRTFSWPIFCKLPPARAEPRKLSGPQWQMIIAFVSGTFSSRWTSDFILHV